MGLSADPPMIIEEYPTAEAQSSLRGSFSHLDGQVRLCSITCKSLHLSMSTVERLAQEV